MEIYRELKGRYGTISKNNVIRASKYIVLTGCDLTDYASIIGLELLRDNINNKIPNDTAKYCLPEAYKTALVMTINARALQNFINLRSDKHALLEIQHLAHKMYEVIPEEHNFLFADYLKETK